MIDYLDPPSKFSSLIKDRTDRLSQKVNLRNGKKGIKFSSLNKKITKNSINYKNVFVKIDRKKHIAELKILGPKICLCLLQNY